MDITVTINELLSLLYSMLARCYSILDSITFAGISLLQFMITVAVLGVVITILFTLAPGASIDSSRTYASRQKRYKEYREKRRSK